LKFSQKRPLKDTVARNAITKFDNMLSKKFEEQLKDFSEEDYRKLESLQELFNFIDDIIPEDEDEEEVPKRKPGRKRYTPCCSRCPVADPFLGAPRA
jgi:condensin complex subunit 3